MAFRVENQIKLFDSRHDLKSMTKKLFEYYLINIKN